MILKLPVGLLCASALSFTVGLWDEGGPGRVAEAAERPVAGGVAGRGPLAGALEVRVGEAVEFDFLVAQQADRRLELSFPDGRTHEIEVLDARGALVWRWSEERLFTRAMQQRVLRPGDQLAFHERWVPSAPGAYTAVATLRATGHAVTERVAFVVPAG